MIINNGKRDRKSGNALDLYQEVPASLDRTRYQVKMRASVWNIGGRQNSVNGFQSRRKDNT